MVKQHKDKDKEKDQKKKPPPCKEKKDSTKKKPCEKKKYGKQKLLPQELCDRKSHKDENLNEWDLAELPVAQKLWEEQKNQGTLENNVPFSPYIG